MTDCKEVIYTILKNRLRKKAEVILAQLLSLSTLKKKP
jgi:hypothetical protein